MARASKQGWVADLSALVGSPMRQAPGSAGLSPGGGSR
jgi:hypothetical protein